MTLEKLRRLSNKHGFIQMQADYYGSVPAGINPALAFMFYITGEFMRKTGVRKSLGGITVLMKLIKGELTEGAGE